SLSDLSLFLSVQPRPPLSSLFPYTTLFRSGADPGHEVGDLAVGLAPDLGAGRAVVRLRVGLVEVLVGQEGALLVADPLGDLVVRSEEHTSELQSRENLVCRLLLEKKNVVTL